MVIKGYEERYCLFLDILGFQSHVDETVARKSETVYTMTFSKLKEALNFISDGVHYKEAIEISGKIQKSSREVTQFSDSIVISYLKTELNGSGVGSILADVHKLQLNLINRGILLRGAVTSGLLYHDKNIVFGPALNEAVALEKLANYPRVILDGEILDDAGIKKKSNSHFNYDRTISSMVTDDFDGLYYVDYFNVIPDDFDDDWESLSEYLESLRRLIKSLANKKNPSIKVKHSWLRTKFNLMAKDLKKNKYTKIGIHYIPEDEIQMFISIKPF